MMRSKLSAIIWRAALAVSAAVATQGVDAHDQLEPKQASASPATTPSYAKERRFPSGAIPLQPLIDGTPAGGELTLKPGVYAGPAVISRPMTLKGEPGAILHGGGVGSILALRADGSTVQGLVFRDSGDRHEETDAGLQLRGEYNVVKDNVFENCLFGIDLQKAHNNVLRRNRISSQRAEQGVRGDAIRVWYSNDVRVEDNVVEDSRDSVIWYSHGVTMRGNSFARGRYGVHLMYAHGNEIVDNRFFANTVGVFLMYSNDNRVQRNVIRYSQGPSGIGVGFKESSGAKILDNDVFANAQGFYLDASPYDPDSDNLFRGNRLAYNGVAVLMHSDWAGNDFLANDFVGNHATIAVNGGGSAARNRWEGNYFDDYQGFDRDRDGVGDTPHEAWSWADRLWTDVKDAQFFRASPSLEMIDLVERMASLVDPRLLLRDARPAMASTAIGAEGGKEALTR
jgi:nitrous oxidase accessory protein